MKLNRVSLRYNLESIEVQVKTVQVSDRVNSYAQDSTGRRILKSDLGKIKSTSNKLESISLFSYCKLEDLANIKIKLQLELEKLYKTRKDRFERFEKAYLIFK